MKKTTKDLLDYLTFKLKVHEEAAKALTIRIKETQALTEEVKNEN